MANRSRKRKVSVKEMKFKHDPMIRLYDRTQEWLQEKGRPFVIGIGIIAGVVLLYVAGSYFFEYRKSSAEAAFAAAVEKFNAPVQDEAPSSTPPAGKTYADEQTKWRESAEAFERLASDYSGYYGSIGRYYAGVCYLHIDRPRGIDMLKQVAAKNDKPTSDLAKLALAENYAANDENQDAIKLYEELLSSSTNLKTAVEVGLGHVYEKAGEIEKAADAYVEAAKPDRSSEAGLEAEKRLQAIAPDRLKELPPPSTLPFQP